MADNEIGALLDTARVALADAERRLNDIARMSNGAHEEIYNRAYSGVQRRALEKLGRPGRVAD